MYNEMSNFIAIFNFFSITNPYIFKAKYKFAWQKHTLTLDKPLYVDDIIRRVIKKFIDDPYIYIFIIYL